MKYFIETYGCQMNVHDSERMAGLLEQAGYEATPDANDADVRRHQHVQRSRAGGREALHAARRDSAGAARKPAVRPIVAVAGCVAQQEGGALLKRSNMIDVIVGTQSLKQLPIADRPGARRCDCRAAHRRQRLRGRVVSARRRAARHDPVKAYVTIIEGCNEFCSFCVVPYTRGHERMRPKRDIVNEVIQAAGEGHREIQLLGQIVNHYQAPDDPACDFAALLEAVHDVPGVERIRFASPHPRHVPMRLIEAVRDLPKVCKHFHLPVQSGSTRVLEAMRRRYTRESYLELVAKLRDDGAGHRADDGHDRRVSGRDGRGFRRDA